MQHKTLRLTFLLPLFGLALGACSQQGDDSAATPAVDDTAVHTAEVSAAGVDELMAKGEAIFLANCSACHQPSGVGLPGAFPPLPAFHSLRVPCFERLLPHNAYLV